MKVHTVMKKANQLGLHQPNSNTKRSLQNYIQFNDSC